MLSALQRRVARLEQGKAKAQHMRAELDQFATWARLEIDAGKLDADFVEVLRAIKGWSFGSFDAVMERHASRCRIDVTKVGPNFRRPTIS